jgi:hypothetical protein
MGSGGPWQFDGARGGTSLRRMVVGALVLASTLAMLTAWPSAASARGSGTTSLTTSSDPGDYIGGGQRLTLGPADGTFTVTGDQRSAHVSFFGAGGADFWFLDFAAPANRVLVPGPYPGATRYPFQSPTGAGLSISGQGRGCNTLTGRFVVLEYVLSPSGTVERFAAAFEQHCEGMAPALRGVIRYNASATFPPAPDMDSDRVPDSIDNCVTAPNADQADSDHDGLGDVCDPTSTSTSLTFVSDPGDYIGQGVTRTWYPSDGEFTAFASPGHVQVGFNGGTDWWYLIFAAPEGHQLQPGTYEGAARFQSATSPGLDVFGSGRGCNQVTGRFVIHELAVAPDGSVLRFVADFEQHCEGGAPALRGTIEYSA